MKSPHPRSRHDTRAHILATANPIILGKGFSAVGLNEILSAAGVPKGSFYHYFESKEHFGAELIRSYFDRYEAMLAELLGNDARAGRERLMGYWRMWLEHQACGDSSQECLAVKLAAEVSDLSEVMRDALEQGMQRVIRRIRVAIEVGQRDGSLPLKIEPAATALGLYSMWLGASILSKVRRSGEPLEVALGLTESWLSP
jgi:TetR/AcrR family transcriptional repressor of nem operon